MRRLVSIREAEEGEPRDSEYTEVEEAPVSSVPVVPQARKQRKRKEAPHALPPQQKRQPPMNLPPAQPVLPLPAATEKSVSIDSIDFFTMKPKPIWQFRDSPIVNLLDSEEEGEDAMWVETRGKVRGTQWSYDDEVCNVVLGYKKGVAEHMKYLMSDEGRRSIQEKQYDKLDKSTKKLLRWRRQYRRDHQEIFDRLKT